MSAVDSTCFIHLKSSGNTSTEPLLALTERRWMKLQQCVPEWTQLDGEEKEIALKIHPAIQIQFDADKGHMYHPLCYKLFTDKKRIEGAKTRKLKGRSVSYQTSEDLSETEDTVEQDVATPKRLRSSSVFSSAGAVLPEICVICKAKDRYIVSKNKRQRDRLVQAETTAAGQLCQAAEAKRDESILVHIRGKDCVANEVRYHRYCYREYVRFLSKPKPEQSERSAQLEAAYVELCEDIIKKRIIENQEILRMSPLTSYFAQKQQQHSSDDPSFIRSDQLKRWISRDFPQLVFHRPRNRNQSEMVYVEALSTTTVLQKISIPYIKPTAALGSASEEEDSSEEYPGLVGCNENLYTLFNAGLLIKASLAETPGMKTPWPPTSDVLTCEEAASVIPNELFNFLSWVVGASNEPTLENLVISEDIRLKILSLCQDIVYLASSGKKQTPKSLALGLTARHLTGSSHLLDLLNNFGHSASYKTIVGLETSLAQLQLLNDNLIPKGFAKGSPTVLVWDNIDFSEETSTGAGTTHHTNGIMVQSQVNIHVSDQAQQRISLPKRQPLIPVETCLQIYHQKPRQGPDNISTEVNIEKDPYMSKVYTAEVLDLLYIFMKQADVDGQLPGWRGFNMQLNGDNLVRKSAIYYLPMIEASPTEMNTVSTVFKRSLEIADSLELQHIVLVFDQAIYAKAQQIRWADEILTKRTIIRLGEFHTCMSFMSILGKRFMDAGLQDVLIESQVIAPGSINGVSSGHHYNRSLRAHKLMYEALHRLRLKAFLESLSDQHVAEHYIDMVQNMVSLYPGESLMDFIRSSEWMPMLERYQVFIKETSSNNPTFGMWSSYIEMVQLLLTFIRATRESDWDLHLASIRMMMPWYFAYDRVNYARYLPAYWLEMLNLPTTHPECHMTITATGEWTVQRQEKHPFSSIACDQAIEQTVNRDSKTAGGLRGITLNRAAVQRWVLAHPEKSAITRQCELMAGLSAELRTSKELDRSRIKQDEISIKTIMTTLENMVNPFQCSHKNLVSLSSGCVASAEVQNDLLNAEDLGEKALNQFIKERLLHKTTGLFTTLKSQKLKTFGDMLKSVKTAKTGKEIQLKNDRALFARLLIISQSRNIDLKEILSYSLGTISFPLASSDGSLAKTTKSSLLQHLEENAENCLVTAVPEDSAIIVDAMALIQSRRHVPSTFIDLADAILTEIISLATKYNCIRVDFVADRYPTVSIKNPERSRRAATGSETIKIYGREQQTPRQWKKFLSCGTNKEALLTFLHSSWRTANFQALKRDIDIYVTYGHTCNCDLLSVRGGECTVLPVEELNCDHEEADTRLLLHAHHAQATSLNVLIHSPDTDVAVIAISQISNFYRNLFFLTGVQNKKRIINLQAVVNTLSPKLCQALIGIHVFTGCDSVSAFYGKGKKKGFKVASENEDFLNAFIELGSTFQLKAATTETLETYVCKLYGHPNYKDVNAVRYSVFCTSQSELTMPPTKDALLQHCKRANYQSAIHRRSLQQFIDAPSPSNHGWEIKENDLKIVWMTRDPAPEQVLGTIHCQCKTSLCNSKRCSCKSFGLPCTDLCRCKTCENQPSQEPEDHGYSDNDSDSDRE